MCINIFHRITSTNCNCLYHYPLYNLKAINLWPRQLCLVANRIPIIPYIFTVLVDFGQFIIKFCLNGREMSQFHNCTTPFSMQKAHMLSEIVQS